jgi:hypothetical protein
MVTISIQQLHNETERFVRQAAEEEIWVVVDGKIVAVLGRPQALAVDFETYWRQREQRLSGIRLLGDWDSTEAVSQDRERL